MRKFKANARSKFRSLERTLNKRCSNAPAKVTGKLPSGAHCPQIEAWCNEVQCGTCSHAPVAKKVCIACININDKILPFYSTTHVCSRCGENKIIQLFIGED